MLYLIATVLLNVVVSAIFKIFPYYHINRQVAITTNYIVCVLTGSLFIGYFPVSGPTLYAQWFPWAVALGASFYLVFNLMAWCARENGMATMVIAGKLSLVIPVVCAVVLYGDKLEPLKVLGILLSVPAVILSSRSSNEQKNTGGLLLWPALLFLLSGTLDTLVNYIQHTFLHSRPDQAAFTVVTFAAAALSGLASAPFVTGQKNDRESFIRNIAAGVCLGIPNFFSIYLFVRALHTSVLQSSAVIPIINIGILVLSVLTAVLFFREKAGKLRQLGIALALAAILLIAVGDLF